MLEQLITELIAALKENTAAQSSRLTVTSGTTTTSDTAPVATEEPKKTRKGKTAAPVAETTVAEQSAKASGVEVISDATIAETKVEEKKPDAPKEITLEDVRTVGAELRDLTSSTEVIRAYVTKALPGVAKPSLRLLPPEKFADAYAFLSAELAKAKAA